MSKVIFFVAVALILLAPLLARSLLMIARSDNFCNQERYEAKTSATSASKITTPATGSREMRLALPMRANPI